jgi:glutamine synthetase
VKPVDAAANPYLAVAAILASAVDGVQRRVKLPDPVEIDPSRLSDEERAHRGIRRLPADLATALDLLDGSEFFRAVFGDVLLDAYLAVRRHEAETFGRRPPQNVADAVRWRY